MGEWAVEISLDGHATATTTSIGWRLMHAYDCTNAFTHRAFGTGGHDWNDIEVPGTAAGAVALMEQAVVHLRVQASSANDDVLLGPLDEDFQKPR